MGSTLHLNLRIKAPLRRVRTYQYTSSLFNILHKIIQLLFKNHQTCMEIKVGNNCTIRVSLIGPLEHSTMRKSLLRKTNLMDIRSGSNTLGIFMREKILGLKCQSLFSRVDLLCRIGINRIKELSSRDHLKITMPNFTTNTKLLLEVPN